MAEIGQPLEQLLAQLLSDNPRQVEDSWVKIVNASLCTDPLLHRFTDVNALLLVERLKFPDRPDSHSAWCLLLSSSPETAQLISEPLVELLWGSDERVKRHVLAILNEKKIPPSPQLLSRIPSLLAGKSSGLRQNAYELFTWIGEAGRPFWHYFRHGLCDPDFSVRHYALHALGAQRFRSTRVLQYLFRCTRFRSKNKSKQSSITQGAGAGVVAAARNMTDLKQIRWMMERLLAQRDLPMPDKIVREQLAKGYDILLAKEI